LNFFAGIFPPEKNWPKILFAAILVGLALLVVWLWKLTKDYYPAKAIKIKAFFAKKVFNEPIRGLYIGSLALSQYGIKCFHSFNSKQGPETDEVPLFECIF
jgi:hypothetical protein